MREVDIMNEEVKEAQWKIKFGKSAIMVEIMKYLWFPKTWRLIWKRKRVSKIGKWKYYVNKLNNLRSKNKTTMKFCNNNQNYEIYVMWCPKIEILNNLRRNKSGGKSITVESIIIVPIVKYVWFLITWKLVWEYKEKDNHGGNNLNKLRR